MTKGVISRYEDDAQKAVKLIVAQIPSHPSILSMDDPYLLYKLTPLDPAFKEALNACGLSYGQAVGALRVAQHQYQTRPR